MGYLDWAKRNRLDLKFDLSRDDMKWITANGVRKYFDMFAAYKLQFSVPSYELVHQLEELAAV